MLRTQLDAERRRQNIAPEHEVGLKVDGRETAGNGHEALTVEILAEEAVDDRIGGAVAVAEKLENCEEDASDGATLSAPVPQQIHLSIRSAQFDITVNEIGKNQSCFKGRGKY